MSVSVSTMGRVYKKSSTTAPKAVVIEEEDGTSPGGTPTAAGENRILGSGREIRANDY